MKIINAITASLAALVAACATVPVATPTEQITVSRGPCFGFCPVYEIQLLGPATVGFHGIRHTAFVGQKQDAASRDAVAAVATQLAPYRPTSGARAFDCPSAVTDQATFTIRWQRPGSDPVSLTFDGGCRSAESDRLRAILDAVPAQLGLADEAAQLTRPGSSRG